MPGALIEEGSGVRRDFAPDVDLAGDGGGDEGSAVFVEEGDFAQGAVDDIINVDYSFIKKSNDIRLFS